MLHLNFAAGEGASLTALSTAGVGADEAMERTPRGVVDKLLNRKSCKKCALSV